MFFIKRKPVFSNGPRIPLRSPPDCTILGRWLVNNFILADELFANALRSLETCLPDNNDYAEK